MLPRFIMRMKRRGGYKQDFNNRFGIYRPEVEQALKDTRRVWVHAVSVGEASIAFSFMDAWRKADPEVQFVLSITTSTAADIARKRLDERDELIYFPLDWPPIVNKVVNLINPLGLYIVETEIWPNLVRRMNKSGIPVAMINGRISDTSYPRYCKVRFFTKRLLPLFDMFCMQSEEDKERIVALGARPEIVHVLQSAKYEVATRDAEREATAAATLAQIGFGSDKTILMGASTWPGEEKILCDIFRKLQSDFPQLKLLLVPRHFERADDVLRDLKDSGLCIRQKSKWDSEEGDCDIFVLDTTGELMHHYAAASLVFVGKSLCDKGGQNIIEPACVGKPILVGPHMRNFHRIVKDFLSAKALVQVQDADELAQQIRYLLENPEEAKTIGDEAETLVESKAGALTRTVELVRQLL